MLKDYFDSLGRSLYSVAKDSRIPYSTLNDLVNGKVRISECKAGMVHKLAGTLGISMDELYALSEGGEASKGEVMTSYGVPIKIGIKHKAYQIDFDYEGEHITMDLCKVSEASTFYLEDIAKWRAEGYIREFRMNGKKDDREEEQQDIKRTARNKKDGRK